MFAGAMAAMAGAPAAAVGLGPVDQQSALGQPLRVVIPLIADGGEDLASECFKLAPAELDVDGVPQVHFGRLSLERRPTGAQLVVIHSRPVNDPVLRLTVQVGCDAGVRREYLLFMDPPVIDVPQLPADTEPRADAEAAPPPASAAAARIANAPGAGNARRAPPKAIPAGRRAASRPLVNRAPSGVAGEPRLKLAAAAPATTPGTGAPGSQARQAQLQQEQADAIEAETVVLRQRIAELTATVERLQQEMKAAEAAEAADRAVEPIAKAPPPPPQPAWWEANWPLLAVVAGLPILIAGGLLWKRRQELAGRAADWQTSGVTQSRSMAPAEPDQEIHAPESSAASARPRTDARTPPRAPGSANTVKALAVSELLHVTEEARVYVALGHPDRAIDVLNEHLRRSPRSIPAAWLMLLDLYHANDRRQDFRRLAEEFHAQCNVQTPLWEGFAPSAANDVGLEAFPHIARGIVAVWRKPECRTYLERLLYDNREGRRTGFPLGAYSDILTLLQISDATPAIDIDSDLALEGRLGPASSSPAVAAASGSTRVPRRTTAQPATPASPPQKPLTFELDLDGASRNPGRKPPPH